MPKRILFVFTSANQTLTGANTASPLDLRGAFDRGRREIVLIA